MKPSSLKKCGDITAPSLTIRKSTWLPVRPAAIFQSAGAAFGIGRFASSALTAVFGCGDCEETGSVSLTLAWPGMQISAHISHLASAFTVTCPAVLSFAGGDKVTGR